MHRDCITARLESGEIEVDGIPGDHLINTKGGRERYKKMQSKQAKGSFALALLRFFITLSPKTTLVARVYVILSKVSLIVNCNEQTLNSETGISTGTSTSRN